MKHLHQFSDDELTIPTNNSPEYWQRIKDRQPLRPPMARPGDYVFSYIRGGFLPLIHVYWDATAPLPHWHGSVEGHGADLIDFGLACNSPLGTCARTNAAVAYDCGVAVAMEQQPPAPVEWAMRDHRSAYSAGFRYGLFWRADQ